MLYQVSNAHHLVVYYKYLVDWWKTPFPGYIPEQSYYIYNKDLISKMFSSVQFSCSVVSDSLRPHGSTPGLTNFEPTQTHVHWVSDAIQPSHLLLSPSPPAFSLSQHQGLFQWVGSLNQVAKVSFSFGISPSNEYSGLISFRIDWFDLLAIQETLKSLF